MASYATINPKLMEIEGRQIADTQEDPKQGPLDRMWTKTAFMVSDEEIGEGVDIINRYWSSASAKFVDGRIGCNIGINQRPQWTRYSDIRVKGRFSGRPDVTLHSTSGDFGLGRAWSENIDDPAQKIFMRFGVPKFNSLTDFMLNAFNREMTIMARTGRAPSAWYTAAKIAGTAIAFTMAPLLTIAVEAGKAVSWLMGRPTSAFFSLKPTMHLYWSMVNSLCLNHAVNSGIIKKIATGDGEEGQRLGRPYTIDGDQLKSLHRLIPDIINEDGAFDVYSIANKAQRQANAMFEIDYKELNVADSTNFEGYLKRDSTGNGRHNTYQSDSKSEHTLSAFFNNMTMLGDYYMAPQEDPATGTQNAATELDPRVDITSKDGTQKTTGGYIDSLKKNMDAEWRDGAAFAVFRVDSTGSIQESFGNSVAESALQQKLNGVSNDFREARFSLADGNFIGGMIGEIGNKITEVGLGLLDGVSLGSAGLIAGLAGSGYVDIPKHWQSSSASLPRGSYTIQLISPYNNPISRMINIWIPFYMLLSSALPRSTGKQSYTSPFYCQIYDRGRLQSRLAMVESLSITRGTSNLQWDTKGQAMAIDVNINVVMLSSIMHMPMSTGGVLETDMTMDDDNITSDYLNVLAGMDIYSQIYAWPKAQLKLTKKLASLKQKATSPAFHVSLFKNSVEDGMINDLTFGLSGLASEGFGAAARGAALLEGDRF